MILLLKQWGKCQISAINDGSTPNLTNQKPGKIGWRQPGKQNSR
jgi:hypothetical protein